MKNWFAISLLFAASGVFAAGDTLVFLDLPEKYQKSTIDALDSTSTIDSDIKIVYSEDEYRNTKAEQDFAYVVATSGAGCKYILEYEPVESALYVCSLIQSRDFYELGKKYSDRSFLALAIDQPEERQIQITRKIFPQLQKFAILESDPESRPSSELDSDSEVTRTRFRPRVSLSKQINSILQSNDAVVAIPDSRIYSKDNIRTILFTAYTSEKPIIGYSPGYVRAGALISAYSTPQQLMKQLNEILAEASSNASETRQRIIYPKYYSISVNHSVAESLSLFNAIDVEENKTYVDGDFE